MADPQSLLLAQGINQNLAALVQTMNSRFALAAFQGSLTMGAAASTTVTDAKTKGASVILLMPTNAAAATLEAGVGKPYVSARNAGASFVLTCASGSAAGTETYDYVIVNVG